MSQAVFPLKTLHQLPFELMWKEDREEGTGLVKENEKTRRGCFEGLGKDRKKRREEGGKEMEDRGLKLSPCNCSETL